MKQRSGSFNLTPWTIDDLPGKYKYANITGLPGKEPPSAFENYKAAKEAGISMIKPTRLPQAAIEEVLRQEIEAAIRKAFKAQ